MGGTIGGPVYWPGKFNRAKDKLFFFVSIEDSPIKTPDGLKYYRVPTALEAAGNFSQTYNQNTTAAQGPGTPVPYGAEFQNPSPAGGLLPDNFFRPYPGFGSINYQKYNLTANYNSLQVRLTRRFNRGLEFGGAYTFSRSMDNGTCSTTGCSDAYNFTSALHQSQRAWNYGPASYDIKHNLVVNYLWSLPKASRVWSNFATRAALDN